MFDTAVQYLNITSALITVGGIIFLVQILFKWQNSPRFSIGVLATSKEREDEGLASVGKASYFDEFTFDQRYLAKRLRGESELSSLKFDNDSSRSVYIDKDGHIKLPVIIQNNGNSEGQYSVAVTFSNPGIRVTSVKTESLDVESLYTQDDSFITDRALAEKTPASELQDIYRDLNLIGDYLCLRGSLNSRAYEAVYLQLHLPSDCKDFTILFKIDCPEFFNCERQVSGQYINVFEGKA